MTRSSAGLGFLRSIGRASVAMTIATACGACSGNGLFATAGDYSAYRATRVEPTLERRLAAAQRYLKQRPNGAFQAQVRAYFEHAEDVFYASKRGSKTGLHAYLDALPEGPHKEEAVGLLTEYERPSDLEKAASAAEARVAGPAATARAAVRRELSDWLARWLDPSAFRAPLHDAKAELVIAYALSLPSPRCEILDPSQGAVARRCAKLLSLPYEVDGARASEPREATLEITVLEDAHGIPLEVTLGGPDLFLRVEETYRIKPIAPDDEPERLAAAKRAASLVRRVFARVVSDADGCVRPADPPTALRLACDGVQAEVFPATNPGEDDLVTIVPVAHAPRRATPSADSGRRAPGRRMLRPDSRD